MHTILIIEDEQEIADNLEYVIKTEGMNVLWVSNGADAEKTLHEQDVSLCILDIGLPDCSGFELLKAIRQSNYDYRDVPVLMLTARNEEIDRIVGLEVGADDYVAKPFSPREVVARIKVILKRTLNNSLMHASKPIDNGVNNESNSIGDFCHQKHLCEIYYQEHKLNLTKAEYSLLSAFLNSPQQVFSRRQLIDTVWSSQHPSDDRAIDTHIKTLRAKLRSHNPHREFIVTHRGFGYSLNL